MEKLGMEKTDQTENFNELAQEELAQEEFDQQETKEQIEDDEESEQKTNQTDQVKVIADKFTDDAFNSAMANFAKAFQEEHDKQVSQLQNQSEDDEESEQNNTTDIEEESDINGLVENENNTTDTEEKSDVNDLMEKDKTENIVSDLVNDIVEKVEGDVRTNDISDVVNNPGERAEEDVYTKETNVETPTKHCESGVCNMKCGNSEENIVDDVVEKVEEAVINDIEKRVADFVVNEIDEVASSVVTPIENTIKDLLNTATNKIEKGEDEENKKRSVSFSDEDKEIDIKLQNTNPTTNNKQPKKMNYSIPIVVGSVVAVGVAALFTTFSK